MTTTPKFIDLDRRFRDLTDEEREDPSILALFGSDEMFGGDRWSTLLQSDRVIILAEAGAGKTKEMEAQADRLVADGNAGFFVPVEALDRDGLEGFLSADKAAHKRLTQWLADAGQPGWFFVDAVDELKLTDGKLSSALTKLARDLGDNLARARIFISCRPTDWRPVQDLETFRKLLPGGKPIKDKAPEGEEAFVAPFAKEDASEPNKTPSDVKSERCVVLLALGQKQIETFARERGVADVAAFISELRRRDAWSFARRPLDLQGLLDAYELTGTIGTRREQHEADITLALRDDPDRSDQGLITTEQAIEGIQRLALAMLLSRTRTVRSPELAVQAATDTSSLDAEAILDDWSPKQVKALLRRSIFDPATYGRVRFHHRSIQEYLAAQRIEFLRTKGLPEREVRRLLFAQTYGEEVLIPSMRPVSAWLAGRDRNLASEVLRREPETLVLHGDPETLPFDTRVALVRAYVTAYSGGGWRGLDMPIDELRRLAHDDLEPIIRECWATARENEEVSEFLLKLIWLGGLNACADIAFEAVNDTSLGGYARVLAGRALLECKRTDMLVDVGQAMVRDPDQWPERVIHGLSAEMFPDAISAADLGLLVQRTVEPKRTVGGFSWALLQRVGSLNPTATSTVALTKFLTDLIWKGRKPGKRQRGSSGYSYLSPTLAKLAAMQLMAGATSKDLVRAAAVANQLRDEHSTAREEFGALRDWLTSQPVLREKIFWAEIEAVRELDPSDDVWHWVYHANEHSLLGRPQSADHAWLLRGLAKSKPAQTRRVALEALLWAWRGAGPIDNAAVRKAVADDADLLETFEQRTAPRVEDPRERKWREQSERRNKQDEAERAVVQQGWREWSVKLKADPGKAFSGREKAKTRWNLFRWLGFAKQKNDGSYQLARQNWASIRTAVSPEVGELFEKSMLEVWRKTKPPIHSRRKKEEQNSIFHTQGYALTGLSIEAASSPGWASKLTANQARRAAEWATLELNGFPDWLPALWDAHPKAVSAVFLTEIDWELQDVQARESANVVSSLRYGPSGLAKRVASHLLAILAKWPKLPKKAASRARYLKNLEDVITIVSDDPNSASGLAAVAARRFTSGCNAESAALWLNALAVVDLRKAAKAMRKALSQLSSADKQRKAIEWFGALFGDRGRHGASVSLDVDTELLVELTKLAYDYIRRENDQVHDGPYSPDIRDDAESARNRLLGAVIGKPGPEAHAGLKALAQEPLFAHMPDRLRRHARERASLDSEPRALSAAEVRAWEKTFATPPRTRDDLFRAMLDRLEDMTHDILHHDFNDRIQLEAIKLEEEMQPLLAKKFEDMAVGHYSVAREEVVAGNKETDIRLVVSAGLKAVTEIKIGDRYSVNELLDALENQLVAKYLRHASCSAGCLLITYGGRKGFQWPVTGNDLSFGEVIALLKARAQELEAAHSGRIRLDVVGLDLRDPLLH